MDIKLTQEERKERLLKIKPQIQWAIAKIGNIDIIKKSFIEASLENGETQEEAEEMWKGITP